MSNRTEAEAQGFTVDDTCYPWVAYKGARFGPLEWHPIMTDKEAKLLAALKLLAAMDSPGYGRKLIAGEVHDVASASIRNVEGRRV